MGFHKAKFYIASVDNTFKIVEGWADETNTFGFHKLEKIGPKSGKPAAWKWVATDIPSGLRICTFDTRKECAEWVWLNKRIIDEQKQTDRYKERVHLLSQRG